MRITFGLLGAGRIGKTHATALAGLADTKLAAVFDPIDAAAEAIQKMTGARRASVDDILADKKIDAILICTPTDLHAAQIEAGAKAGKAIFCEKPIDLDVPRARACLEVVDKAKAKLMVGFNRRFDPHFAAVRSRIDNGEIGDVELVQITSRDPGPPPLDYVKRSGGLFRDMMIHDFDMARYLLGEDPVEVTAAGSVLVDKAIGKAGDVDTASATLRTASGKIAVITNSRRATYGYDQRIEVHGAKGRLAAGNVMPTTVELADARSISGDKPMHFFLERYADAYRLELDAFVKAVTRGGPLPVTAEDGRRALVLAEAALQSLKSGKAVRIEP